MPLSFIRATGKKHAVYAGKAFTVRGYYTRVEPKNGENFQNTDADGKSNGGGIYEKNGRNFKNTSYNSLKIQKKCI